MLLFVAGNSYGAYNYHPGTTFCYPDPRENCAAPYDLFMLLKLFIIWKTRMMNRHAASTRSSKSLFREQCALMRGVYAALEESHSWLPYLYTRVCLPDF
ncbi:hypothetical protein V5799_033856 [Amblyomma americanum]|uniref:Uncharacterized protein n=1 Tax=Amblyomma americanum TaxID=6943 RepID=A0AAQ4DM45_AMBAM